MRILGAVLVILGAWMLLAVPVALVCGRFMRGAKSVQLTGEDVPSSGGVVR